MLSWVSLLLLEITIAIVVITGSDIATRRDRVMTREEIVVGAIYNDSHNRDNNVVGEVKVLYVRDCYYQRPMVCGGLEDVYGIEVGVLLLWPGSIQEAEAEELTFDLDVFCERFKLSEKFRLLE